MTKRSIGSLILLFIFTCGIYSIYWFVVTTNEIEASLKEKDGSVSSGGMCFLLAIVTCGIYYLYWYYKQGKRIGQLRKEAGLSENDNSTIYIILSLFGLSVVSDLIMQSDINAICDAKK